MIRVFVGFDRRETVAYHTLCHSILDKASEPVSFTPVKYSHIKGIYHRPWHPKQSTSFSITRFLVPWLSGYQGYSIFMDCDMLCRGDIAELWALRDSSKAVQVVKHDYTPATSVKFLGHEQTAYTKKNWSSVMILNNAKCRNLTPEYVNNAGGLDLHQFKWCEESDVGALPMAWNHLVGELPHDPGAKLVHYTLGGPYFGYESEFYREWHEARADMVYSARVVAPLTRASKR